MSFVLDDRLAADSVFVTDLPLCEVRLMNDATWLWLLLVPRRAGLSEIIDLPPEDRHRLMDEIARASAVVRDAAAADKLNVAALGNMVRQLHVHVIARHGGDPAWPGPVWGKVPPVPYDETTLEERIGTLARAFG